MSRIRTIKPEFWRHEELSELPEATHMLAAALLNYADDDGYFNANPKLVRAECCPLREPSVSVQDSLNQLEKIGFIDTGVAPDGKRYGRIVKFSEHQRINRPSPSKIKALPIEWESSVRAHAQGSEDSPPEGKGREEEKNIVGSATAEPHPADAGGLDVHPEEPRARAVTYPQVFDELWNEYRAICDAATAEPGSKKNAFEKWRKLSAEDRQRCFDGVMQYLLWRMDRVEKPGVFTAQPKHFERFISGRLWETYQAEAA